MTDQQIAQRLGVILEKHRKKLSEWEAEYCQGNVGALYFSDNSRAVALKIIGKVDNDPKQRAKAHIQTWDEASACQHCCDGLMVLREPLAPRDGVKPVNRYHEAVFPCSCARGALRASWQDWPRSGAEALQAGWFTKEDWKEHHYREGGL